MKMGKHVYCQKPLTQTVYEAREMRKLAKEKKLATQMGNQGSAGDGLRRAVEVFQAGIIGAVREVHVWSNRPIWPQGIPRRRVRTQFRTNSIGTCGSGRRPMRPVQRRACITRSIGAVGRISARARWAIWLATR